MFSIGKITLDGNYNYGNKLQNYALQQCLKQFCPTVDTLIHDEEDFHVLRPMGQSVCKNIVKFCINWKGYRDKILANSLGRDAIRSYRISQFDRKYINSYHLKKQETLEQVGNRYNYWITGSDQVWNPSYKAEEMPAVFLDFAAPSKRIAYAASFGVSEIPDSWKSQFASWLGNMAYISVREEKGQEIVKTLTGRDVSVLVDPTMLLTRKEWDMVASKPSWFNNEKPYILLYFLSAIPEDAVNEIRRIAKNDHLQVIDLMNMENLDYYTSDPAEFIYLIAHASLVYTDSFHGSVFSILYERPFVICDRQGFNATTSMNSRIDTLLNLFGLQHRLGNHRNHFAVPHPLETSFSDVKGILDHERTRSDSYIRQALKFNRE